MTIQDINNVFINQGPGKFSGIRASIAVAKGICIGNNLDLYGVDVENCWPSVNTFDDIERVLKYIENNPEQQNIIKKIIN